MFAQKNHINNASYLAYKNDTPFCVFNISKLAVFKS